MKMDKLLNQRVVKMKVKDLKKALMDADDESDVVLSFMMYDKGRESVYLAEAYTHMKYDPVLKERVFDDVVVELLGFTDEHSTYVERKE